MGTAYPRLARQSPHKESVVLQTYRIAGYRIAARSQAQAEKAAQELLKRDVPRDWPGERYGKRLEPTRLRDETQAA